MFLVLFGKVDFLLQDFKQGDQAVDSLLHPLITFGIDLFEFYVDKLSQIRSTHCVLTCEIARLYDLIAEHAPYFLVSFVL